MRRALLFIVFTATALLPQGVVLPPGRPGPVPPQFPTALRFYLELSDTQVEAINQANADYLRLVSTRVLRVSQIQQEIADETAKEVIDPMALGLGYREIESIRRFLEGEQAKLRDRVRQVLTERQRPKLAALEEAAKLMPVYSEAVSVNLLAPQPSRWFTPVPGVIGTFLGVPTPAPAPGGPQEP